MANVLKIFLPLVLLVVYLSVFFVDERQNAILFKFGEIVDADYEPGLHWKLPYPFNEVKKFDKRILTIDTRPGSFATVEQKYLIVDSYVKWRIEDVATYYQTTSGNESTAGALLYEVINNGLRAEFGKRTIQEVVAGERTDIMRLMTDRASEKADTLGIKVVDVRIKKIELPSEVSSSVYNRMRTGRELVARDWRSKGEEASERIRADADRQSTVILAEAYRDSEIVRGDGDAEATATYAEAFGIDRVFYNFYRSLNAYTGNFSASDDVILLEPDSEYFKYFKDPSSK
ncbi:MAG: protease modulator HflC [Gammaproteobacteria bacterium]|jgi:membrane protease subunit HflC|nr:protease modulator HflC [Gammaproteobacteria bacterium]